nr:homeobox protein cut isoform X2 [Onthophagus taurus]
MQPSASVSSPTEMDLQAMQSMSWLFKKENFFNLAQFYQHTAALKDKDIAELKGQVASLENKLEANMDRHSFESEITAKEKQISQLVEELQRKEATIAKLHEGFSKVPILEEQLDQKNQYIAKLEAKLESQKDYEDIKKELSILRLSTPTTTPSLENQKPLNLDNLKLEPVITKSPEPSLPEERKSPKTTPFPPHFQNVETFGTLLGEEIVANWKRSIETLSGKAVLSETETTEKSTASTPQPQEIIRQNSPIINGQNNPKSPEDNNNLSHNNNNNNIPILTSNVTVLANNFLKTEDLKSPFRFEDHQPQQQQHPQQQQRSFRFAEDMGLPPGSMVGRLGESLIPKGDPMEARLQEMLRFNMDKYASQNLDTLHISRKVRELLSIHNIGQRLFAKYILGLSQGTVSELLSKPKPWDKLTEKGRDSYRKMHAWSCDENAVLLLKSLIPKKDNFSTGKEIASYGGRQETGPREADFNDERIAHILNEASQIHGSKHNLQTTEDTHSNEDSKSPQGCSSPFSKDSSQNRKLKKYENDDISQEKVARIYQEEMAKLMGRRIEDFRTSRDAMFLPQIFAGGHLERSQEEMRALLDAYHQLAKMNSCGNQGGFGNFGLLALHQQALAQQNGGVQDLSLPKDKKINGDDQSKEDNNTKDDSNLPNSKVGSAFSLVKPKLETSSSTTSSPLGNTILPPIGGGGDVDFGTAASASPLQRMASITNSLISQPPSQPHPTTNQRPLKAVLPPITQQQFDMYNNLNTEDIVKKVKEQLSQYSISQRLFGESVLGLSQGSVSDLLARPKPWHMLTQKGREPFIRMKMFLEDDNAVHKLVASQYKIAPEKLMRTGGYGGACNIKGNLNQNTKILTDATGILTQLSKDVQNPLLPPNFNHNLTNLAQNQLSNLTSNQLSNLSSNHSATPMLLTPPGVPPHHAISLQSQQDHQQQQHQMKKSSVSPHLGMGPTPGGVVPNQQQQQPHGVAMRSLHQHISPSVYEMAALTQDLDTQVITTKIKEALLANNIGQKIFGEAVLGLSQGSVSELLSKPKPWHMLSIKGREPFIRMQLWLNDAHNVDRLQALKNERREANKRRRSSGPGTHDNSSDTSSNDTSEYYHSNSPGPGPPVPKKQRVLFTEYQKIALNVAYDLKNYPNQSDTDFLAMELGLPDRTVSNWFHNHRMRLKPSGNTIDREQSQNQPGLDPTRFRLLLNKKMLELSQERIGLANLPIGYPYLASNPNIAAALISRGLLPSELDLNSLNNAVKEQMSGLDLTISSSGIKRESPDFVEDDEEIISNASEDSNLSENHLNSTQNKENSNRTLPNHQNPHQNQHQIHHHHHHHQNNQSRSSRRKPAAPQWVNPDQNHHQTHHQNDEVIINGVCVMQTDDFSRRNSLETVRIEPQAVVDGFDVDDRSETSSVSQENDHHHNRDHREGDQRRLSESLAEKNDGDDVKNENDGVEGVVERVKQERDDEDGHEGLDDSRWDY